MTRALWQLPTIYVANKNYILMRILMQMFSSLMLPSPWSYLFFIFIIRTIVFAVAMAINATSETTVVITWAIKQNFLVVISSSLSCITANRIHRVIEGPIKKWWASVLSSSCLLWNLLTPGFPVDYLRGFRLHSKPFILSPGTLPTGMHDSDSQAPPPRAPGDTQVVVDATWTPSAACY